MKSKAIDKQLKEDRILIENAMKNQEIQQRLLTLGYPPENLQKGKELLESTVMLHQLQRDCYGDQYEATDSVSEDYQALKATYKDHVALSQMAFRGQRGIKTKLGINQPIAQGKAEWTNQAFNFYSKAPQYQKQLGRFGVTKAELEQALAALEAFIDLQDQQTDKMGAAQRATQQRNQAMKALRKWIKGFKAIVRTAVDDEEQLLEILGMVVPS